MDRQISQEEQKSARIKKISIWVIGFIIAAIIFWAYQKLLTRSVDFNDIYTATIEMGDIDQTLTASGTVIPAYERVINAPVVTEITKIHLTNGAEVVPGSKILELDQEFTRLEYDKLNDELSLRKNNIDKLKLLYDKELRELDIKNQIKGLEISEMDAQLKSQIRLKNVGGAAEEDIEKVKLKLSIMGLEKKMLENELTYRKSHNIVEKQNLGLEYEIQVKRLAELKRKLSETTVHSDTKGVITWINENIGKTVQIGEPLVRIADLQNYRVEAVTSDRNSEKLKPGTQVSVRINNQDLFGTITHTLPTVENNTIKFHIALDDAANKLLRPNLKTDVYIITDKKTQVKKLKIG
ncbi:MAG TPA: HlyD family efflux transporter periplasmic adaptor subunit, partial [Saprospiraceae bacterium]|nr:HlyD family efflux transporter periplasmic adaptor subunit [Saprospiraceae bacterium]